MERAQSQNMTVETVDTDPFVLSVTNETSDRVHTVIPKSLHCSCEDHTYRDMMCKHLIAVLDDEELGEKARGLMADRRNEIDRQLDDLYVEVNELESTRKSVQAVFNELDLDHDAPETNEAVTELVHEMKAEPGTTLSKSTELQELTSELTGFQDGDDE